ncbi:hypothetical protein [Microbacterium sp. bgisy207]|uniref:hypothetical protein n=1 Tax=Microbacterium sp. bgisy207 TaxID=3413800 RepID=UPI003EBB7AC4
MKNQEGIALGLIVGGLIVGILCLLGDIWGGPSFLHVFTMVGGFAVGYGTVTLVLSRRGKLP